MRELSVYSDSATSSALECASGQHILILTVFMTFSSKRLIMKVAPSGMPEPSGYSSLIARPHSYNLLHCGSGSKLLDATNSISHREGRAVGHAGSLRVLQVRRLKVRHRRSSRQLLQLQKR